jgi:hypothetical protein
LAEGALLAMGGAGAGGADPNGEAEGALKDIGGNGAAETFEGPPMLAPNPETPLDWKELAVNGAPDPNDNEPNGAVDGVLEALLAVLLPNPNDEAV